MGFNSAIFQEIIIPDPDKFEAFIHWRFNTFPLSNDFWSQFICLFFIFKKNGKNISQFSKLVFCLKEPVLADKGIHYNKNTVSSFQVKAGKVLLFGCKRTVHGIDKGFELAHFFIEPGLYFIQKHDKG